MKDEESDSRPDSASGDCSRSSTGAGAGGAAGNHADGRKKCDRKKETRAERKARAAQRKAFLDEREKQIGILWAEFNRLFPTESDCLRALCFGYGDSEGYLKCPYCDNLQKELAFEGRNTICVKCKREIWYTADSPFKDNKKPRAWLAHIWLMGKGMLLSSSAFHRLVGVAQSTALDIFKAVTHRVLHVMDRADTELVLRASSEFIETFLRRSIETPKHAHPSDEQESYEQELSMEAEASNDVAEFDFSPFASESTEPTDFSERSANSRGDNWPDRETPGDYSMALSSFSFSSSQENDAGSRKIFADSEESWLSRFAELLPLSFVMQGKSVLDILSAIPIHLSKICQMLGVSPGEIAAVLTVFEMEGLVHRHPGDSYSLNQKHSFNLGRAALLGKEEASENSSGGNCLTWLGSVIASKFDSQFNSKSASGGERNFQSDGRANFNCSSSLPLSREFAATFFEEEIDIFHRFIWLIYHGISRKYLAHYLAAYWIQISERWRGDRLLRLMQVRGPVLRDEIQASVTPLMVRFPRLADLELSH
jgi:hypothetical protein